MFPIWRIKTFEQQSMAFFFGRHGENVIKNISPCWDESNPEHRMWSCQQQVQVAGEHVVEGFRRCNAALWWHMRQMENSLGQLNMQEGLQNCCFLYCATSGCPDYLSIRIILMTHSFYFLSLICSNQTVCTSVLYVDKIWWHGDQRKYANKYISSVESTFSSSLRYFKRFPPPTGLKQHSEKESESVLH